MAGPDVEQRLMPTAASSNVVRLRGSVKSCLQGLHAQGNSDVVVASSGGPDSLVLLATACWVGERAGFAVHSITVNHQLQEGSGIVAGEAASAAITLGAASAEVVSVEVGAAGGLEAAARDARYAALQEYAGGRPVLLGHTRNDQAETVLLRLLRGAGSRTIGAMCRCDPPWHRPFLAHPRSDIESAVPEILTPAGVTPWSDPHNSEQRFARVLMRDHLESLSSDFGPGIISGLARSAELARDDNDALDAIAAEFPREVASGSDTVHLDAKALGELPRAVRTRVLRLAYLDVARISPSRSPLNFDQVGVIDALVSSWSGQGAVSLPLGVTVHREYGRLIFTGGESGSTRKRDVNE